MNIQDVLATCEGNLMVSSALYDDGMRTIKPQFMTTNSSIIIQYDLSNKTMLEDTTITKIVNQLELMGGFVTYNISMALRYLTFHYSPNIH